MTEFLPLGGLDTDDLTNLAEFFEIDVKSVMAIAKANSTLLEEAAHYAALDALRDHIVTLNMTPKKGN